MIADDGKDIQWMERALLLAERGKYTTRPNPVVGCVLVKENKIVGEGAHWQAGGYHAEVIALNEAKEAAKDSTCYVTLEPCSHVGRTPPCVDALIEANVKEVVIATRDPNPMVNGKGIDALKAAGILVREGILEARAISLNKGFFSRMKHQRPYVRAKIAMSLDGRTAMKNGESQWITSEAARCDVHHFRAQSGAIITSNKTVLRDNCRLTVRGIDMGLPEGVAFHSPMRVVLDTHQQLTPDATIFKQEGKTWHAVSEKRVKRADPNVIVFAEKEEHVDLKRVLAWLAEQQINDVWVEAGPTLLGAMLKAKLMDEIIVYIAPKWLGHNALPMMNLPGIEALSEHIAGHFTEVKLIGQDIRVVVCLSEGQRGEYGYS